MSKTGESSPIDLLRRVSAASVVFSAFLVAAQALAAPISGTTAWFHEDAETFAQNAAGRWRAEPGVASARDGKVAISLISTDGETASSELVYAPELLSGDKMVVGEHVMSFDGPGDDAFDAGDAFVGVQVLEPAENPGSLLFAVLNPLRGSDAWVMTETPAEKGVDYVVRVEADTTAGAEIATYFVKKAGEASFVRIADIALPKGVAAPGEVVYVGNGTLTEMDAGFQSGGKNPRAQYHNWAYADRIMTYKGQGPKFVEWVFENNAWRDGSATWTGDEAVSLFPTSALRFTNGLDTATATLNPELNGDIVIGGMFVDANAQTYTLKQTGTKAYTTGLGDPSGKNETWFWLDRSITIDRRYASLTFYGEINVRVTKSGNYFNINRNANATSCPTRLDPASRTRLKCHGSGQIRLAMLDATGPVTIDYSDLDPARTTPFINGPVRIDESTTIVLPEGIQPGASFKLCTGTLTGGSTTPQPRTISIGGKTFVAMVSFSGNAMTYQLKGYSGWTKEQPVLTWAGAGSSMADGAFTLFDPATGYDTTTNFLASGAYFDVPGWEGSLVRRFSWIFSGDFSSGSSLPFALDKSYVLRFFQGAGVSGDLLTPEPRMTVGGLLVEGGAADFRLAGESGIDDVVVLGREAASVTNHVSVDETFGTAGKAVEFVGLVDLDVAAGKSFVADGNAAVTPTYQSPDTPAELRFSGQGVATCNWLRANGAVTLNYAALPLSRTTPYVNGSLELDEHTRLVLPAGLAAGTAFPLCSGTLSASTGIRAIALGDGDFFLAKTTFDPKAKTVKYATSAVNRATLTGDVHWEDISWAGGYDASRPVELTLAADVRVQFDVEGTQLPDLLVLGNHRLSLTGVHLPALGKTFLGRGAKMDVVVESFTAGFGGAYSVPSGVPYETVFAGSGAMLAPSVWSGRVIVAGRLRTTGYLELTNDRNLVENGGVITVSSGRLTYAGEGGENATFNLGGELSLGERPLAPGRGTRLNFLPGGTLTADANGALVVAEPLMMTAREADEVVISAPMVCDAPVAMPVCGTGTVVSFVATNSAYGLDGLVYPFGDGAIGLDRNATVSFGSDSFVTGGLFGAGTAVFSGDPTDTGVCESLVAEAWQGVCWLRGATLNAFDPGSFGHENSVVRLEGCSGYFAKDATFEPTIDLATSSTEFPVALSVRNGFANAEIPLDRLVGDGKLELEESPHQDAYRVFIPSTTEFTGSLSVVGGGNRNGIVIGARDAAERAASFTTGQGMISMLRGMAQIAAGASWSAAKGISLSEESTVVDSGLILSAMKGAGTVKYRGEISSAYPESTAAYDDGDAWFGKIWFEEAVLANANFTHGGNAGSKIVFADCSGSLAPQTVPAPVVMAGKGLRITSAANNAEVTFSGLEGTGAFSLDYGATGANSAYRAIDPVGFSGKLTVNTSKGTMVLGDMERTLDGALEFADGVAISTGGDWAAPRVRFGSTLAVNGHVGDSVVKITGDTVGLGKVAVRFVGGEDVRRRAILAFDIVNLLVYVKAQSTPPTMTVSDIGVVYGVDFTNATVKVSVQDYWAGYDFTGAAVAEYLIYDDEGNLVGYGSKVIGGDGTFEIGVADLPLGRGTGYRFDVVVNTDDTTSGEVESVEERSIGASGAHWDAAWFHETAETFAAPAGDPSKTGMWHYEPGAAVRNGERIDISTAAIGGDVRFRPTISPSNDIVTVEMDVTLGECGDEEATASRNPLAALVLAEAATPSGFGYGVWSPEANGVGAFETVFGTAEPVPGDSCRVTVTFNNKTGYMNYAVDGNVLTNASGISSFRFSGSANDIRDIGFFGAGAVRELEGNQLNGNLAYVVSGGVTNEYDTVDEAVAAAVSGGVTNVSLMWNASWRPKSADVGKTFVFELTREDGSEWDLVVDSSAVETLERTGYRILDNGRGSFTVGVFDYELSFAPNDAVGVMPSQFFSVTNMVFALISNQFARAGSDFDAWNRFEDGSGTNRWADGAEIDMTEFGLTNVTLYAQWKVARRTVTIEPSDEFVYVERIATNGCSDVTAHYRQTLAEKGAGRVEVELVHGSDLEITFSTDIEKALTYSVTNLYGVTESETLPSAYLPKILSPLSPGLSSALEAWASANGISRLALSSPYALTSCTLNLSHLMTESSEVRISDFTADGEGCSFRVTIDGEPVTDLSKVLPMVRTTGDLSGTWSAPSENAVAIDADGKIRIVAGAGTFVKIVIPKGN